MIHNPKNLKIIFGKYQNNRTAIQLVKKDSGEPYATATVNLPEVIVPDGMVLLKGWSENTGIPKLLEDMNIVKLTGMTIPTGFVKAELAVLIVNPWGYNA